MTSISNGQLAPDNGEIKKSGTQVNLEDTEKNLRSELTGLSKHEYGVNRQILGKKYGMTLNLLDGLYKECETKGNKTQDERNEIVEQLEEWPNEVNGEELANHIRTCINRYCVLPDHCDVALTLWILSSYSMNNFRIYPKLTIYSPQMRCGKTTTLEVLQSLSYRALAASNLTSAVIYRVIQKHQPTLLIDEADTFLEGNHEMRGIINSGHNKSGAAVLRCHGDTNDPVKYSTWTPTVIAKIGEIPSTIADRSILVPLQRKPADISVDKLPIDLVELNLDIRRKILKWTIDNADHIARQESEIPDVNNNRASDNWLPLITIADLISSEWKALARDAMLNIERMKSVEDDTTLLLRDIRELCEKEKDWIKAIPSRDLAEQLNKLHDSPWPSMRRDQGISGTVLSKMLRPFGLIASTKRVSLYKTVRAYDRERFDAVCEQYIPRKDVTSSQINTDALSVYSKDNTSIDVSDSKYFESNSNADCDDVTSFPEDSAVDLMPPDDQEWLEDYEKSERNKKF